MRTPIVARLRAASRNGRRQDRVSILLPFLIISIGLGALAWRSYNLSVRMEQGARTVSEQYAAYAAEITARRIDAAVRAEMTTVSDEWQQIERRIGDPTLIALRKWVMEHTWVISAIYVPDDDPASSIYVAEPSATRNADRMRVTREFFTSTGTLRYTYDPRRLLATVGDAIPQPSLRNNEAAALALQQEAEIAVLQTRKHGGEELDESFVFISPLSPPLSDFGVRAVVPAAYASGRGWENQRVVSLWVSLLALTLTGVGALLALRGMRKEAETMTLRGALIANVSHELRTPLSMIRLGAETLKRGKLKDNERAEIEDQILREVLLLSHLVENVLDVARIQNQSRSALAFTPVDPRSLIRNLVSTYESWIRSKGFTVGLRLDETVSEQMWDRDAVSRALLNLIDNAIKYSGEAEKAIDVTLRQTHEHVVIEVKDHGIGIEPKDVSRLFEPYFRAQFSDTTTRRGAGLGLTLVQQIVQSHGGAVEVESAVGIGSIFRLLFPRDLSRDPLQAPAVGRAHEAF